MKAYYYTFVTHYSNDYKNSAFIKKKALMICQFDSEVTGLLPYAIHAVSDSGRKRLNTNNSFK